jgi:hypothetical protein
MPLLTQEGPDDAWVEDDADQPKMPELFHPIL